MSNSKCFSSLVWHYLYLNPSRYNVPDSKVHGTNMGPTWVLSAPGGPHIGPMSLVIWVCFLSLSWVCCCQWWNLPSINICLRAIQTIWEGSIPNALSIWWQYFKGDIFKMYFRTRKNLNFIKFHWHLFLNVQLTVRKHLSVGAFHEVITWSNAHPVQWNFIKYTSPDVNY